MRESGVQIIQTKAKRNYLIERRERSLWLFNKEIVLHRLYEISDGVKGYWRRMGTVISVAIYFACQIPQHLGCRHFCRVYHSAR